MAAAPQPSPTVISTGPTPIDELDQAHLSRSGAGRSPSLLPAGRGLIIDVDPEPLMRIVHGTSSPKVPSPAVVEFRHTPTYTESLGAQGIRGGPRGGRHRGFCRPNDTA